MAYLAGQIGRRNAGTEGERRAGEYLFQQLGALGYQPRFQVVPLPGGRQSRNVLATLPGRTQATIVVGAHYDTSGFSPGANDNGTGVAAVLEIARALKDEPPDVTVAFVFFGAEEMVDRDPDHHHYGSRLYVQSMDPATRNRTRAMVSVDMIGYGPEFLVRTMGTGPQSLRDYVLGLARAQSVPLAYLRDPGASGWSDHGPFELAGIPAAWLEWRDDPSYHTAADLPAHVSAEKVRMTGQLSLDLLRRIQADELLFCDVPLSGMYRAAIVGLAREGIVGGYADNTFRPAQSLLRAQFAKMLVLTAGLPVEESMVARFSDLPPDPPTDLYPHDYIAAAAGTGLVRGRTDGTFAPFSAVTRAQAVTMVVRAAARYVPGGLTEVPTGYVASWTTLGGEHGGNARLAEANGLLAGLPLAGAARDPWAPMPRAEAAQLLWNLLGAIRTP